MLMSLSNQVSRDAAAELWLADIQEAVKEANQESQKTLKSESGQGFPAKVYSGQQINTNCVCLCLFVCSVSGYSSCESGSKREQSQSDTPCSDYARDSAAGSHPCMCCRLSEGTLQSDHRQDPRRCDTHVQSLSPRKKHTFLAS